MQQGTIDLTIDLFDEELHLTEVPYTVEVEQDAGCRTFRNGDPGVPPTVTADVTLDWSMKDAVEAVETWFREDGRTVPDWVQRRARAIQEAITEELNRLLWEGRI